jgi:hypothetical protein
LAFNGNDDDAEQRHEFHGREILRAATLAVGGSNPAAIEPHPNYVRFRPPAADSPRLSVDDLLRLVHHLVFRRQQLQALQTDLRPLMKSLLRRVRVDDIDALHTAFRVHLRKELRTLHAPRRPHTPFENRLRRLALRRALDWTAGFHRSLLREWACGQALQRTTSLTRELQHMMHPLWYFPRQRAPRVDRLDRVLELALERLGAFARDSWQRTPRQSAVSPLPPSRQSTLCTPPADSPWP